MNTYTDEQLKTIVDAIIAEQPKDKKSFDNIKRKISSKLRISQPSNAQIFKSYQNFCKKERVQPNHELVRFFQKANIRSHSGIAVITSLVKPYMCPGKCVYCPTEVRMPKSYIATEPAAARALRLDFDPYEQMQRRIEMLERNGHPSDKIEFIIKGGTWNAYPLRYQYWFILESFLACNEPLGKRRKPGYKGSKDPKRFTETTPLKVLQAAMEKEQRKNEHAKYRIIGLTLETRPDAISPRSILHMRKQGCTRIELGLQAPDDKILKLIQRGHTVDQFRAAMYMLRQVGFKVDLHFMPDLPGTTPEHDVEMYKQVFDDLSLRPDMIKIYPNTVIKTAELYEWFKDGRYKPYGEEALFDALLEMKRYTPRYCRISRLIRDIPEPEIEAGNKITNLREELQNHLHKNGERCVCLRCREIVRQEKNIPKNTEPELFIDKYETDGGTEYFITYEDPKRIAVYGFLRLRILHDDKAEQDKHYSYKTLPLKKLQDIASGTKAFVRELHVYGYLVQIGDKDKGASQHKGIGKKLVAAAEDIVRKQGLDKVMVISGVGVRGYYRKLGYRKSKTYMVKNLKLKN